MTFTLITVTAKYRKQDGTAAAGQVEFRLSTPLIDGSTNEMRQPIEVKAILDVTGSISVPLTATNDPTTTPTGATYEVTERVGGAYLRVYSIEVPYNAAGGTIDLADIIPVTAQPAGPFEIQDEGTAVSTQRTKLNFAGTGVSAVDNPAQGRVDITVAAGGHVVKEDGTPLTARAGLNFGDGLTATDDAGGNETDVTVAASHGGGTHAATQAAAEATAAAADAAHVAAGNPHAVYTTDAEATALADASVATHAGVADPHTGYQRESQPYLVPDGTVGAPSIAPASEPGTGVSFAAGIIRWSIATVERMKLSATELLVSAGLRVTGTTRLDNYVDLTEIAAPAGPAANTARLYPKDVAGLTELFYKNSAGTERDLSAGGSAFAAVKVANDYAGADLGAKINAADADLGANPGEIWVYGGGAITTQVTISGYHHLRIGPGSWTCGVTASQAAQFLMKDNSSAMGAGYSTVIREPIGSTRDGVGTWRFFQDYNGSIQNYERSENIEVAHMQLTGAQPYFDSTQAAVGLGNIWNGRIHHVYFNGTRSLGAYLGGGSTALQARTVIGVTVSTSETVRIQTSTAHGYIEGQRVVISGVGGAVNANGSFVVYKVLGTDLFSLVGLTATGGTYTSGGSVSVNNNANYSSITDCTFDGVASQNAGVVNGNNIQISRNILMRAGQKFSGFVSTNGTDVTWISGQDFTRWYGTAGGHVVTINGVQYTTASVTDSTHATLTGSAGVQASAFYTWFGPGAAYIDNEPNASTDTLENFEINDNIIFAMGSAASGNGIMVIPGVAVTLTGPGTISNNTIYGGRFITGQGGNDISSGIMCTGVSDAVISGNTIRRVGQWGIYLGGTRLLVSDNNLTEAGGQGSMYMESLTYSRIVDNKYSIGNPQIGTADPLITELAASGYNVYEGNQGFTYTLQSTSRILSQTDASGNVARTEGVETIAYAASITPNALTGAVKNVGALTGNITVNAPTNALKGLDLTLLFLQDGTGGRTVTWNAAFLHSWSDTGNTANLRASVTYKYDGTNWVQIGAARGWTAAGEPTADAHIADASDAHDASAVSVADTAGLFAATDVEAALAEIRKPDRSRVLLEEDFITGSDSSNSIGTLGWARTNGANALEAVVLDHLGLMRISVSTSEVMTLHTRNNAAIGVMFSANSFDNTLIFRLNQTDSDTVFRFGMGNSASSNPPADGIFIEKVAADTEFFGVVRASAAQTRTAALLTVASATWYRFRIRRIDASTVGFTIDNGTELTLAVTQPTASLVPFVQIGSIAVAAKSADLDYWSMLITGLSR